MVRTEVSVWTPKGDYFLRGRSFWCQGSDAELYPIDRGDTVGSALKYCTFDSESERVENRSQDPLRGCINFGEGGTCKIGSKLCPVSSAVTIVEFRQRQEALRRLPVTSIRPY